MQEEGGVKRDEERYLEAENQAHVDCQGKPASCLEQHESERGVIVVDASNRAAHAVLREQPHPMLEDSDVGCPGRMQGEGADQACKNRERGLWCLALEECSHGVGDPVADAG